MRPQFAADLHDDIRQKIKFMSCMMDNGEGRDLMMHFFLITMIPMYKRQSID